MSITLTHPEGTVLIEDSPDGRRKRIEVVPADAAKFIPRANCETSYSIELIESILGVKGASWLCDEIARDEDSQYVQKYLRDELFAYFAPEDLKGKRILDFGCGSGASTAILARLFPNSEIVGIELFEPLLNIARQRIRFYNFPNVDLRQSPSETELPRNLGQFDIVVLSAVFEHFLPAERTTLMPEIWAAVRDEGFLFLDQTPNLLFPLELHTTMLPLINYLPDSLAYGAALRFSKRINPADSWESLLRQGIRGATVREISRLLPGGKLIEPSRNGVRDRIDLYYLTTDAQRLKAVKSIAKKLLKAIKFTTGAAVVPDLALVFRKSNWLENKIL